MEQTKKLRKPTRKELSILRHLARQSDHNAETTLFYSYEWPALNRLRERGFVGPNLSTTPGAGSPVTPAGRAYLAELDSNAD